MDKLFGDLKTFWKVRKATVDNFVFRLHYRFTMVILIAFSILVTGKQYIGDPIDCISRDDIPPELLDTFCWVHTTFSVESAWFKKVGEEIPYPGVESFVKGEKRIYHAYYQWVCFVLFFQAILFYLPRYFWKNMEGHKIQNVVMNLHSPIVVPNDDYPWDKKKQVELVADYLEENRGNHRVYSAFFIIAETLNFINVVGQIYLTDVFLGREFTTYGINVVNFTEWDWTLRYDPMIRVFPRMTKCTFHRFGSSGDVQKHDAMCLLPINIVNEKIYIFLWFWFIILAILSGLSVLYRFGAFVSLRFRFYVLHSFCRSVSGNKLMKILKQCDSADWLVMLFLCQNMDDSNFNDVINEYANRIKFDRDSDYDENSRLTLPEPLVQQALPSAPAQQSFLQKNIGLKALPRLGPSK